LKERNQNHIIKQDIDKYEKNLEKHKSPD